MATPLSSINEEPTLQSIIRALLTGDVERVGPVLYGCVSPVIQHVLLAVGRRKCKFCTARRDKAVAELVRHRQAVFVQHPCVEVRAVGAANSTKYLRDQRLRSRREGGAGCLKCVYGLVAIQATYIYLHKFRLIPTGAKLAALQQANFPSTLSGGGKAENEKTGSWMDGFIYMRSQTLDAEKRRIPR